MKRNTVHIALVGVNDLQSRALVSASTVIQTRLPADLAWQNDVRQADIIILNTSAPTGSDLAGQLRAENDAVLVPYVETGECPEHGISRPLRMPALQEALTRALRRVLDRPPPTVEQVATRSYRGQALASATASEPARSKAANAGFQRMYRGRPAD